MNDAGNHALLVVALYIAWTLALSMMGGAKILFQYDSFPDENEGK